MAQVISNRRLSQDFYLMRLAQPNDARMGQFCMLRAWERYPLLSRPISVFDSDSKTLSFLYKTVGEGTKLLAECREGDEVKTGRVLGNTFPLVSGKIALVGGGVGIAPLYLAAKTLKTNNPATTVHLYLGFSDKPLLTEQYGAVSDRTIVKVGGFITDAVDPEHYDVILTCGPEAMMRALYGKCRPSGTRLYASLESRMACGFGVCLACSCGTAEGQARKRICTDGPVFLAEEVF